MYGNNGYAGVNNQGGYSYANPQNLYMGKPVEEIKALNQEASKQYDEGVAAKNALDLLYNNLDVEERGKHIKDRAFNEYVSKIQGLVKSGAYQDAKYLINDLTQSYKNDKELQGALKSRAAEKAYYEDLRNRLEAGTQSQTSTEKDKDGKEVTKRTGGINKDIYEYAIRNTKKNNQDKLEYDPETGLITNAFKGHNVVDDKSKEIYDEMYARTKDWKADSIEANGQTFKVNPNIPGGYINFQTGKEVTKEEVQNALRTELENRNDFKDFLNQEKEIHKDRITGGTGNISLENLSQLGVSDGTLMKALNEGATQSDFNSFYDKLYRDNQLDKYTDPASDKAAYKDINNDFKVNEILLENLKHKHRLAEKELEGKPMLPTNSSAIVKSTPQDVLDSHKLINDILSEKTGLINEVRNPQTTPERRAEIAQRLAILDNKEKVVRKNDSDMESKMKQDGYITNDVYAEHLDRTQKGETMLFDLAKAINNLPANKVSTTLKANAQMIMSNQRSSLDTQQFLDEAEKYIDSKRLVDNLKENMKTEADKDRANPQENAASGLGDFSDLIGALITKKQAYIEKEKPIQYTTNLVNIDEKEGNKDSHNKLNIELRNQIESSIRTPSSEWLTEGGKALYDIGSGKVDGYELYDDKGKKAIADLTKSKATLAEKTVNGEMPTSVTFVDGNGNPLYFKENKQATLMFFPVNPEVTKQVNNLRAEDLFKTGDLQKIKKGVELASDVQVKSYIDKQVNIDRIKKQKAGYAEDFVLNDKQYKLVSTGTGEFHLEDMNDNVIPLHKFPVNGKAFLQTNFKSEEELSEALYLKHNWNKIFKT